MRALLARFEEENGHDEERLLLHEFRKLTWLNSPSIMSHSFRKERTLANQIAAKGYIDGEKKFLVTNLDVHSLLK